MKCDEKLSEHILLGPRSGPSGTEENCLTLWLQAELSDLAHGHDEAVVQPGIVDSLPKNQTFLLVRMVFAWWANGNEEYDD